MNQDQEPDQDDDKSGESLSMSKQDHNYELMGLQKQQNQEIEVLIQYENLKNEQSQQELVRNIDIENALTVREGLYLKKVISILKGLGFNFEAKLIYYYQVDFQSYVYCGIDPIFDDIEVPPEDFQKNRRLQIRVQETNVSLIHHIMSDEFNESNLKNKNEKNQECKQASSKCRRTKERKIGYIIQKVVEWRKYYKGENSENKMSLESSAKKIEISKKSLDDYLLQIRFGKQYGFNFNEHKNDKVGVLRAFVRRQKQLHNQNQPKKPKKGTFATQSKEKEIKPKQEI